MRIPLMRNAFLNEQETKEALSEFILGTSRFSMDAKCYEFEKEFSKFQQSDDAILFNSGGSANLALIQALKNLGRLKNGDRIGFSALTWSTNVMPIIQLGLIPVAIDCNLNTLNVSPETFKKRLSEVNIQAFFITNVLGFVDDILQIKDICHEENIILIEDNCESLGTKYKNTRTGNFGLGASFSFFIAHHMSTIEGGMICTSDEELAEMLRITRANGWDRNLRPDQQDRLRSKHNIKSEFRSKYAFYDLGYNLRPTEITGFLGLFQLKFLNGNIDRREENYLKVANELSGNPDLLKLKYSHIQKLSTFAFPFIFKNEDLMEKYWRIFDKASIETRPVIAGNIQSQPFYKKYVRQHFDLQNTEHIHHCGFYIGNYPELDQDDLDLIVSCFS